MIAIGDDVPMTDLLYVLAIAAFIVSAILNWQARRELKRLNTKIEALNDLEDQLWNTRNMTK